MKKPPRTERRGGQWQYRRRVPTKLVSILGFSEYRESLHTPDMDVARIRAAIRDAEVTVELKAASEQLKKQQADCTKTPIKLTPEALAYIRDAVKAHVLQVDEDFRRSGPDEDSLFEYEHTLGEDFRSMDAALVQYRVPSSPEELGRVGEALQAVGVPMLPEAPEWPDAVHKAAEGYNEALDAIMSRAQGQYVPTPSAPSKPSQIDPEAAPAGGLLLGGC
ncbi:DUF6538 domain-containing protein [Hydrogenophaga sp.]|uniref:DUF6538 domain-containing protein n=1 Tax=Hydrogenophaga sp. TaxID=1904254 RepID=UPI0025B9FE3C|nr:DUF6538 domain-containing protein [Hydrogenophaga sp.]